MNCINETSAIEPGKIWLVILIPSERSVREAEYAGAIHWAMDS